MTSGGFGADNERLARHGQEFTAHAQRAADILAGLRATLADTDGCWGSDAVGSAFAAGYRAGAEEVLHRLGSLPDQIRGVGTRFVETAETYQRAEADNLGRLRSVWRGA